MALMASSYKRYGWAALLFAFCVIAAVRLLDASHHNSGTNDEGAHLAAGMEWLERHTYYVEELHPPLARVLAALPLYMNGVRMKAEKRNAPCTTPFPVYYDRIIESQKKGFFISRCWNTGDFALLKHGNSLKNLMAARYSGIGWMILGTLYLYVLTARLADRETALAAAFIWTMTPLALAHAGLATTDLAAAAAVVMAMAHAVIWLQCRSWRNAMGLGFAFTVCGLVKFSALMYAGLLFIPLLLWESRRQYLRGSLKSFSSRGVLHGAIAVAILLFTTWAAYWFQIGRLADVFPSAYHAMLERPDSLLGALSSLRLLPMPEWFMGWVFAGLKNAKGHATYLLGTPLNDVAVWYFFPVALWFKMPLSIWAMAIAAVSLGIRRRRHWLIWPVLWCAIILLVSMTGNINLGARHILPLIPFLSMIAAAGMILLWQYNLAGRVISIGLSVWLASISLYAHPHYLSFFNQTAGNHPEKILVDSDLAWGQDFGRLVSELKKRDLRHVMICSDEYPRFKEYSRNVQNRIYRYCPTSAPEKGWMIFGYNMYFKSKPDRFDWLKSYTPVAKIGDSYELYHFGK